MPKLKVTEYNLRDKSSHRPKLKTERMKNSYFNRLISMRSMAVLVGCAK